MNLYNYFSLFTSAYQFISVHPSVLASACLYDVILHNVTPSDRIVVLERLAKLTGVEQVKSMLYRRD